MSHYTITSTDAFAISSRAHGEMNLMVELFTKELGRIFARVQNGAAPSSKLRPHIMPGRLMSCDCVKGKGGWKLIGAKAVNRSGTVEGAEIQQRLHKWVRRHLPVEAPQETLFTIMHEVFETIDHAVESKWHISPTALEAYAIATVMTELGYFERPPWFDILEETGLTQVFAESNEKLLTALIPKLNEVMREMHV